MGISVRRVLFASVLATALLLTGCARKPQEETPAPRSEGLKIGYAEGVTVVEDPNALQKAVDEMMEKNQETMGLEYKNEALSDDGINFTCYIANALSNEYDMFIAIYGDEALTDELFLSGLLRPGTAFDHITLEHSLDPGSHTVYAAFTQVEETDGEQAIHAQVIVVMNFTVNG
jgi:hypothetical protein